jgi:hypothetical protein
MCRKGASVVHKKALSRIESHRLKVFVVWTPRYPGDNRTKAVAATKIVPDQRATHYWDANGCLPKHYGRILGLPRGKQFAWDTYMIFEPDSEWKDAPPEPNDWMHQMGGILGRNHPRWLDGDRFRESIQSLVE